jgi:hypothetical protein
MSEHNERDITHDERVVRLTVAELGAVDTALVYYLDTLVRCTRHGDDHGDEKDCDGWGPRGEADLARALDKIMAAEG